MEAAGHRRSQILFRAFFISLVLLQMCMSSPSVAPKAEEPKCQQGREFLTEDSICCDKCPAGFKLVEKCHGHGQRSNCTHCPDGQYLDQMNYSPNCWKCKRCRENEVEKTKCTRDTNTVCRCNDGFYRSYIDSVTYECIKCTACQANEKKIQNCSSDSNTRCECKENYYRVKNKCLPCTNCSAGCKHLCAEPKTTTGLKATSSYLINVIVGVGAVAVAALVLGVIITYIATKQQTKRKLLKLSSREYKESPKLYQEISGHCEEPSDHSLQSVPAHTVISLEPSNLPDCVPLEIRIPEVIYTVLDLVPVMQMKQLVRSLGVTDAVIEQAELDYRFSREAHYQMLRAWAEKGTHACRGGRGGMLHLPLLHELLDKLRQMHLEQTAEELETKYKIQ